jgi:hypothetical protein
MRLCARVRPAAASRHTDTSEGSRPLRMDSRHHSEEDWCSGSGRQVILDIKKPQPKLGNFYVRVRDSKEKFLLVDRDDKRPSYYIGRHTYHTGYSLPRNSGSCALPEAGNNQQQ